MYMVSHVQCHKYMVSHTSVQTQHTLNSGRWSDNDNRLRTESIVSLEAMTNLLCLSSSWKPTTCSSNLVTAVLSVVVAMVTLVAVVPHLKDGGDASEKLQTSSVPTVPYSVEETAVRRGEWKKWTVSQ